MDTKKIVFVIGQFAIVIGGVLAANWIQSKMGKPSMSSPLEVKSE